MSRRGSSDSRIAAVFGLIAFLVIGLFSVTAPVVVHAAPGDVGQAGPSFAGSGADPTGTKPESKVWYNDGFWWASMYNSSASAYTIHRLSGTTWTNTGVVIDSREDTHSDALWDQAAGKLYIASHIYDVSPSTGEPAFLYRYSYNAGTDTYALDGGFPQTITDWGTETLVIDKDSTGQLWATWTRGGSVRVNRTTSGDQTWGAEFVPAVTNPTVATDDISTLVAFGGNKIGLLWSRQNGSPDEFRFSIHDDSAGDTTWGASVSVYPGNNFADDHLNLKADPAGNLFAVVKTSLTSGANLVVLRRSTGGTWTNATFSTGQGTMTRGVLAVDTTNNLLHVFATAPEANGTIYEKTSPLSSLSFAGGLGTQFIRDNSSNHLNNATTTKQTVNSTTGLLVLAGHETLNEYWFNVESLGGGPPPTPTPTPGGSTITLTPAADAQVKSTSAGTNYGSLASIRTRKDPGTADTYQSYLTFNVSGVTGTVNTVKLRLFTSDESPNVQTVNSVDPNAWAEGTLNWNNKPPLGTQRGTGAVPTLGAYNEITLDPAMITGNVPVSIGVTSTNSNSAIFNSKEAGPNPPQLVITQTVANTAPTAVATSKTTAFGTPSTFDLSGTDAENCNLTFSIVQPANGTVTPAVNPVGCTGSGPFTDVNSVTYTPTAGFSGPDPFTFTVNDGTVSSSAATVTMTVSPNTAPTALATSKTTAQDVPVTFDLSGTDAESCNLVFTIVTPPTHGAATLAVNPAGCTGSGPFTDVNSVTYTPTGGYNGPDSFTFKVNDGTVDSTPATVSLTVNPPAPNTAPTAVATSKSLPHDTPLTFDLSGTDAEDCNLTFAVVQPAHGTVTPAVNPAGCTGSGPFTDVNSVTYTPQAGFHGADPFTFTVNDGTVTSSPATVSITVTNAAPTANGSSQTTSQGTPKTFDLTGTDPDDCQLAFAITGPGPTKGTLSVPAAAACTGGSPNSDRSPITYTPTAGQTGADSFTFTVSDGVNTPVQATVNLTITASAPTTATFLPVADAHVSSSSLLGNYGTLTTLKVREGDGSSANPNYRAYLKFNLSGVTGTVSAVKLRLFVTDATADLQSVFVVTDNSWTETAINYTNAPLLTGLTAVGNSTAPTVGAYVEITLTPTTVSASTTTLSLAVKSAATNSAIFSSREDATNKPQLVVTFQ
jgi:hypothetical protein